MGSESSARVNLRAQLHHDLVNRYLPQTGPGGVVQTLGVKVRDVIGKKFKKCCLH
jgi:hypothetical protein